MRLFFFISAIFFCTRSIAQTNGLFLSTGMDSVFSVIKFKTSSGIDSVFFGIAVKSDRNSIHLFNRTVFRLPKSVDGTSYIVNGKAFKIDTLNHGIPLKDDGVKMKIRTRKRKKYDELHETEYYRYKINLRIKKGQKTIFDTTYRDSRIISYEGNKRVDGFEKPKYYIYYFPKFEKYYVSLYIITEDLSIPQMIPLTQKVIVMLF